MTVHDEKQLARQRRELKFRRRLTTLSWMLPVFAFGSFFSIWHNVSAAVNPSTKLTSGNTGVTNAVGTGTVSTSSVQSAPGASMTPPVLFKVGSRSPQVHVIQEQLHQLGYFNHAITDYYGPVTAQAVSAFQSAKHMKTTGEIDNATLSSLQQAVKDHRASNLGTTTPKHHARSSSSHRTAVTSTSSKARSQTGTGTSSHIASASVSHQSIPQTSSSGS